MLDSAYMFADCAECQKLWREYARATAQHVTVEGELDVAARTHGAGRSGLTGEVERAAEARALARKAIRLHESSVHASRNAANFT